MMSSKPAKITFAQIGNGDGGDPVERLAQPYIGHASVDMDDDEAAKLLQRTAGLHGCDLRRIAGYAVSLRLPDLAVAADLLTQLTGRLFVGLSYRCDASAETVGRLLFEPMTRGCTPPELADLRHAFVAGLMAGLRTREYGPGTDLCDLFLETMVVQVLAGIFADAPNAAPVGPSTLDKVSDLIASNRSRIVDFIKVCRPMEGIGMVPDHAETSIAFLAHTEAWGRQHRTISVSREDDRAARAAGGFSLGMQQGSRRSGYNCLAPHEGFWRAWRLAGPVALKGPGESPAVLLAKLAASVAVGFMQTPSRYRSDLGLGELATIRSALTRLEKSFEACHFGDPVLIEDSEARWADAMAIRSADAEDCAYYYGALFDHWQLELSRLRDSIAGRDTEDRRDRLLLNMLADGATIADLIEIDVETLHVDGSEWLRASCPHGQTSYMMGLDDAEDLWALVRDRSEMAGPLFMPSYGAALRSLLDQAAIISMIEARRNASVDPDQAFPCVPMFLKSLRDVGGQLHSHAAYDPVAS